MIAPHFRAGPTFAGLRIGLLGGSFNPAHEGHLAMSLYALKRLGLDQIWWLVSPQNPLKSQKGMAPLAKRLASACRVARHAKIAVTDIEGALQTRYTADTLRALKKRFPKTHFVWLMGADNFIQIPRWRHWPAIFAAMPIAVFRRPGFKAGYGKGKAAARFSKAFRPAGKAGKLAFAPPPAWLVLDNPLHVASATVIRQQRQKRKPRGNT